MVLLQDLHSSFHNRRQIRVSKILVHEDYNNSLNDIALLQLGKNDSCVVMIHFISKTQRSGWISQSSALHVFPTLVKATSTTMGMSMVRKAKLIDKAKPHQSPHSGWGNTVGVQEISTDLLQETEVLIVQTSNCLEKMNQTEGVDEDLIVCAGAGPCKVGQRRSKKS